MRSTRMGKYRYGGTICSKNSEQAAESILLLATTGAEGPNGGFFKDGKRIDW